MFVVQDTKLRERWDEECKGMSERIKEMRSLLRSEIEGLGSSSERERDQIMFQSMICVCLMLGTWNHITDQIGMFCFTGLSFKSHFNLLFGIK